MIVDRYLARETTKPFALTALFLVGVFIAYSLTRFLTEANDGLLDGSAILVLTGLKALIALEVLLPIALYIGLIVALGRLHSDREIIGLRASGFSENRILVPVVSMAVAVAILVAAVSLWVRPWAYQSLYALEADAKANAELEDLPPGRFHIHGDAQRMVFIDERDPATDELRGVFVRSGRGDTLEVISSARGQLTAFARDDAHQLALQQALIYKQASGHGGADRDLAGRFDAFEIWTPAVTADPPGYRPKAQPTSALSASTRDEDHAEVQWRWSTPVSTLLLALVAAPLSRTRPRRGRYARVLLAVIIYVLYFNFIGVARSEVEQGDLAHLWWAPGALAMALAIVWPLARRTAP
ncbi:MAG: LPS export ABC transporter permease LptF [Gammaproteobacteria bacterium]|nr:LPS export ABC transporter permease LptF [Gammaproteobacteria bacterium]MYG13355.1 LPS export ABC transporter permease LptF [Gammaproteobacteria bacterium]MYK29659.1 LPS export ABC transporter permease LptF [Gammaproteobacteria bacterium]